jgi:hypothetical protein
VGKGVSEVSGKVRRSAEIGSADIGSAGIGTASIGKDAELAVVDGPMGNELGSTDELGLT